MPVICSDVRIGTARLSAVTVLLSAATRDDSANTKWTANAHITSTRVANHTRRIGCFSFEEHLSGIFSGDAAGVCSARAHAAYCCQRAYTRLRQNSKRILSTSAGSNHRHRVCAPGVGPPVPCGQVLNSSAPMGRAKENQRLTEELAATQEALRQVNRSEPRP